jgi:ATP-dependent RNA helicase DDX19/DBP5
MNSLNKDNLKYLHSETSTWKTLGVEENLCIKLKSMGFKRPSKIQCDVIKTYKKVRSLFVQSQNGSGKTLAFSIPAVCVAQERDSSITVPSPQVVILGDTNALILQLYSIIDKIVIDYKNICVDFLQKNHTTSPDVDILLTTPIMLCNQFQKKKVMLDKVQMLIVDEADNSLESDKAKNFFLKLLKKDLKMNKPYIILSSATNTKNLREILDKIQEEQNLLRIEKDEDELTLKNVQQYFLSFNHLEEKFVYLQTIIENIDAQNILIFDNSKTHLVQLHQFLVSIGQKTGIVMSGSANVDPKVNEKTLEEFMAGKYRILITTNLLARGIDMRKVTLVINFSLPLQYTDNQNFKNEKLVDLETYLHRVGRTGRFGDHGIALNFVHRNALGHVEDIKSKYEAEINELTTESIEVLKTNLNAIANLNVEKREFLEENI